MQHAYNPLTTSILKTTFSTWIDNFQKNTYAQRIKKIDRKSKLHRVKHILIFTKTSLSLKEQSFKNDKMYGPKILDWEHMYLLQSSIPDLFYLKGMTSGNFTI